MRRLPVSLPAPVRDVIRWLESVEAQPLAHDLVPGAGHDELRGLAALGGLAAAIAPQGCEVAWPESIRQWMADAPRPEKTLVERLITLLDHDRARSVAFLATIYESVVSGANRRRLGTFFTPPELTKYMLAAVSDVMPLPPENVIDPGAGVGAFTDAALERWPKTHVTAVDVNTVTLGLLAALLERHPDGTNRRITYEAANYFFWLKGTWSIVKGPRLILGNPPYTRHQQLSAEEKLAARGASEGLITSGLAGLSAYFLAASLLALTDDDALCLLLPESWCETRYGRDLRSWLWKQTHRHVKVDLFPSRIAVFPGTQVTAMVLTVGPRREEPQLFHVSEADLVSGCVVTRRQLVVDRRQPCPPTITGLLRSARSNDATAEVLGAHARIRRGVATGASEFFYLSDAQRDFAGLPPEVLRPALVKPRHMLDDRLTTTAHNRMGREGRPRWLLDLNNLGESAHANTAVSAYLAAGVARKLHERHLPSKRPHWFMVEQVTSPDLFICPVGRYLHRIILNDAGVVGSNNLYGVYLQQGAPWTDAELALWLRSEDGQDSLRHLARNYQGGSFKIEPRSLRELLVPVVSKATK